MNIEGWILTRITRGEEATVSLAMLEKLMDGTFMGSRIKNWATSFSEKHGCKVTIHFNSDVITFYPITN